MCPNLTKWLKKKAKRQARKERRALCKALEKSMSLKPLKPSKQKRKDNHRPRPQQVA